MPNLFAGFQICPQFCFSELQNEPVDAWVNSFQQQAVLVAIDLISVHRGGSYTARDVCSSRLG